MHLAKYTASAAGALVRHYERKEEDFPGMLVHRKSDRIDPDRTCMNYNLAPEGRGAAYIGTRCEEVRCLKRSDVKVLCTWVVTQPQDLDPRQRDAFFAATYRLLADRYGEANVVSAWVHLDETTPHMHFAWVPVVRDCRRSDLKVSAKECVTRQELKAIHGDLEQALRHDYGIDAHLLTGGTVAPGLTVEQLKTAQGNELADLKRQIVEAKDELQQTQEALTEAQEALQAALDRATHINAQIDKLRREHPSVMRLAEKDEAIGIEVPSRGRSR